MKDVKTIIFDWDGTLHESIEVYYDAFLKAYAFVLNKGLVEPKVYHKQEVCRFLGINPKVMWESIIPHIDEETFIEVSSIISSEMKKRIEEGHAKLYEGTRDVLSYLKSKGYRLIYLSNSKIYYMEAMRKAFQLDDYFDQFYVSEAFNYLPKEEILRKVMPSLQKPLVMIGDRYIDILTAQSNGIKSIGCLYGYGEKEELSDADMFIDKITDLMNIF
ncbi:MAG: HAD family hydrolase [Acholeplasmataceae bacterium]|jgi:phosphoglycolate phosphatase|nr:HAD family hydrolase [Acholeplasmataceae bacterium]